MGNGTSSKIAKRYGVKITAKIPVKNLGVTGSGMKLAKKDEGITVGDLKANAAYMAMGKHEKATGDVYDGLMAYAHSGGGTGSKDTEIIDAVLKGDTTSQYGKWGKAIDDFTLLKGTDELLFRGLSLTDKQVNQLRNGKFVNRSTLSSWSSSDGIAYEFATGNARQNAMTGGKSTNPVMLVLEGGARNFANLGSAIGERTTSTGSEQEWISYSGNKFKVTGTDKNSLRNIGVEIFYVSQK